MRGNSNIKLSKYSTQYLFRAHGKGFSTVNSSTGIDLCRYNIQPTVKCVADGFWYKLRLTTVIYTKPIFLSDLCASH